MEMRYMTYKNEEGQKERFYPITHKDAIVGLTLDEENNDLLDSINNHLKNTNNPHKLDAEDVGAVPIARKVNNKGLSADITLSAEDVGALPLTGGTLEGELLLNSGYSRLVSNTNQLQIEARNVVGNTNNRRLLQLNSSNGSSDVASALRISDIVDGTQTTYDIYGEHNKPTASDVGAMPILAVNWRAYDNIQDAIKAELMNVVGSDKTIDFTAITVGGNPYKVSVNVDNPVVSGTYTNYNGTFVFFRKDSGGTWYFYNVYGEHNKPTPADIGAATSGHTHSNIVTAGDNRSVATVPNDYKNSLIFQGLKYNTTITAPSNSSGVYSYVAGLRGWSDNSGGKAHELAFNNDGLFIRDGETDSWGAWRRVYDSSHKPTPADIGAAASSHNHSAANITSGTLGVARGGTGATTFTSGAALIGAGTGAVTTRAITNNVSATASISVTTNLITEGTLNYALNRANGVAGADTRYTSYIARGIALVTAAPSSLTNGCVALVYS